MNYAGYPGLLVEIEAGIAKLTLNSPDCLNAIDRQLHRQLESVWADLEADPAVNVIVMTGAGKAFSAGGSIKNMVESHRTAAGWRDNLEMLAGSRKLIDAILNLTKPLVAAINGDAMGLGASIGLLADVIVMGESARIGDTHVRVGMVAGDGGAIIWPLQLSIARAKEFLMLGKVIDGREAERIGLVNYAVPMAEVMSKAMAVADELNRLPPLAVRWTKVSINKILKERSNLLMDTGLAYEMLSAGSVDHGEAVRALLERRQPSYRGY